MKIIRPIIANIMAITLAVLLLINILPKKEIPDLYLEHINSVVKITDISNNWYGSGVFISDNLIVTAGHVVWDANELEIELIDGAKYCSTDFYFPDVNEADIAFIKVKTKPVEKAIPISDIEIGEVVFTIGGPLDLFPTLTVGHISNLDIVNDYFGEANLLQTDCQVNPGNSGGALFDTKGNIVGIVIGYKGYSGNGIGFCTTSKTIKKYLKIYLNG